MKFRAGQSGNPGGRPSIKTAAKAAGYDIDDLRKEVITVLVEGMRNKKNATWRRFCTDRLDVRINGPIRELVHVDDTPELTDEQYAAECAEIAREHLAALSPEEKAKLLSIDPAPSPTIQ